MGNIHKLLKGALLFIIIILAGTRAFSCSTPVFRYALEMWPAYAYVIEITHKGNLSSSQHQAMDFLRNAISTDSSANLKIIEKIERDHSEGAIIKMAFPKEHKIPGTIWSGPLTQENAKKIINSPSRTQALQHIKRGDAAVWLFLESGNTVRDDRQFKILEEELIRLSSKLKLSETATDVAGNLLDIKVVNRGVHFSLVRIDRDDPLEEVFIDMLLGTEADLRYFENAPLAFPLFGQGRVLYALAGNGIKSKNIETACSTIIGWCSCIIKDDNPGTDLLFAADWDSIIGDSSWIIPEEVPEITGLSGFISDEEEVTEIMEPENEVPVSEALVTELKAEERLLTVTDETPAQIKEEAEIASEPVVENDNDLNSASVESVQDQSISPLLRNMLITFALILVMITMALFYIKKR